MEIYKKNEILLQLDFNVLKIQNASTKIKNVKVFMSPIQI